MKTIILTILVMFLISSNVYGEENSLTSREPNSEPTWKAPLLSVFIPGGGHFYLNENKMGAVYAVSEILLAGSSLYFISEGASMPLDDKTKADKHYNTGLGFGIAFMAVKITDIIHAGMTSAEKNKQDKLSMGFDLDSQKQIMPKLSYSYNF